MKIKANNYDGYVEIINRIKDIVNGEPLDDMRICSSKKRVEQYSNESLSES